MSAADAVTQDRIYRALKSDYLAGIFSIGARIDLQATADRLRSSKTPVREAIHRLMGEQLVEADPAGGFRICQPTPSQLIQLLAWNLHLLTGLAALMSPADLANRLGRLDGLAPVTSALDIVQRLSGLFVSMGDATGNAEAINAIAHINERLLYVRLAESMAIEDSAKELRILTNTAVTDVQKSIRRRLESYHERRIHRQRELIEGVTPRA